MKQFLASIFLFGWLAFGQAGSTPPIATGVALACASRAACTYVDSPVTVGQHFYFVEAQNSFGTSSPSNSVQLTITPGNQIVTLNWDPAPNPSGVSYLVFRGAPPTGVTITGPH